MRAWLPVQRSGLSAWGVLLFGKGETWARSAAVAALSSGGLLRHIAELLAKTFLRSVAKFIPPWRCLFHAKTRARKRSCLAARSKSSHPAASAQRPACRRRRRRAGERARRRQRCDGRGERAARDQPLGGVPKGVFCIRWFFPTLRSFGFIGLSEELGVFHFEQVRGITVSLSRLYERPLASSRARFEGEIG